MNKRIYSLIVGMAMAVAGMTLAACSDSKDESTTSTDKATQAYLTPTFYVAEAMLDYFDATCTFDGKTVTLTKDNTEAEDMKMEVTSASTGVTEYTTFHMRKYTGDKITYKSFPATMEVKQSATPKAGVDLKTVEKLSQYAMYTTVDLSNNYTKRYSDGEWTSITGDRFKSFFKQNVRLSEMPGDQLSEYSNPSITTAISMSDAMNAVISTVRVPAN